MIPIAPLNGTFMVSNILGFLISIFMIYDKSPTWGFTFALIFVLMFISSIVSMTHANADELIAVETKK